MYESVIGFLKVLTLTEDTEKIPCRSLSQDIQFLCQDFKFGPFGYNECNTDEYNIDTGVNITLIVHTIIWEDIKLWVTYVCILFPTASFPEGTPSWSGDAHPTRSNTPQLELFGYSRVFTGLSSCSEESEVFGGTKGKNRSRSTGCNWPSGEIQLLLLWEMWWRTSKTELQGKSLFP